MMRDPQAMARALIIMSDALIRRTNRMRRLDHDNAAAYARIADLEETVTALEQALTDTEQRAVDAEAEVAQWEALADALGPVGRPS